MPSDSSSQVSTTTGGDPVGGNYMTYSLDKMLDNTYTFGQYYNTLKTLNQANALPNGFGESSTDKTLIGKNKRLRDRNGRGINGIGTKVSTNTATNVLAMDIFVLKDEMNNNNNRPEDIVDNLNIPMLVPSPVDMTMPVPVGLEKQRHDSNSKPSHSEPHYEDDDINIVTENNNNNRPENIVDNLNIPMLVPRPVDMTIPVHVGLEKQRHDSNSKPSHSEPHYEADDINIVMEAFDGIDNMIFQDDTGSLSKKTTSVIEPPEEFKSSVIAEVHRSVDPALEKTADLSVQRNSDISVAIVTPFNVTPKEHNDRNSDDRHTAPRERVNSVVLNGRLHTGEQDRVDVTQPNGGVPKTSNQYTTDRKSKPMKTHGSVTNKKRPSKIAKIPLSNAVKSRVIMFEATRL